MRWQRFLGIVIVTLMIVLTQASSVWAVEYQAIHKFKGGQDGQNPFGSLTLYADGNLYGTTATGGTHELGTVFKLTPNPDGTWTRSTLYNFHDANDAYDPNGSLVFDAAVNLYGTSYYGGIHAWGAVFRLTPTEDGTWTESVLHIFENDGVDGIRPHAGLTLDAAGNLYGTTVLGGGVGCADYGCGTVFKLTPNPDGTWAESILHRFSDSDGFYPYAGLIFDEVGNLYGTTISGGIHGGGTIFSLMPNPDGSWTESLLYSFSGGTDGDVPWAGLTFDPAGNLYGATVTGGAHGFGTVFKLTHDPDGSWKKRNLHSFSGEGGSFPAASLVFDAAGTLYGTTAYDSVYDSGTVFKLVPQPDGHWKFTKLHMFKSGQHPYAGVVADQEGNLYGTTTSGGRMGRCDAKGCGVVFRMAP